MLPAPGEFASITVTRVFAANSTAAFRRSRSRSGGRREPERGRERARSPPARKSDSGRGDGDRDKGGRDLRSTITARGNRDKGDDGDDEPRDSPRGKKDDGDDEEKGKEKEIRNERQAQIEEILKARGAGQYLPPHKLRMLEEAVTDKASEQYQRLTWDALKKSINGLINKVFVAVKLYHA